jgi:hypothetical protein
MNSDKINITAVLLILLFSFGVLTAAGQFTIKPGGFITVKEGGTMMIGTDLEIHSTASGSGYLVDNTVDGDITITGDILVERYLTDDMWHNIASPVSNETSSCYPGTDLVFYYDESIILNDWNFGWVMYSGPLDVFKGYDVIYMDSSPTTVTYQATGSENINTGSYSIGVTITDVAGGEIPSHKGWNLVGNPYPSPVDWLASSGWNKSDINDAKYIWDGTNDVYTIFIGGGAPVGLNGGTQFIPSNQGFWVQAVNNGNISINNAVRIGDITGTPDFYKDGDYDYPLLSLVSSGYGYEDEILIRFIEGTTPGFDLNWDAAKLFSMNDAVPQLSIQEQGSEFALNTYPEIIDDLGINLNFRCSESGYYDISINERTNLDQAIELYLKDEKENQVVDLSKLETYSFYHDPVNDKGRFKLWFNPNQDIKNNLDPVSYFKVHAYKNVITILKNTVKDVAGKVLVYNMLGEIVFFESINNSKTNSYSVELPTGYYIVSIETDIHRSNSKIVIVK